MRSNGGLGLMLTQAALCLVLIATGVDLVRAHGELTQALERQRQNDALITRIDGQLDSLARGTQQLADGGNAHAAQIIAALAQNGVHINTRPHGR
ncbi:hypothetical protein [uncultured Sphingomonas sp.]|uniref:hypothetical protein n=1 Tax=uncultured Sphingomonas sp. TaxID=158754 RepID=UPI0035CC7A88